MSDELLRDYPVVVRVPVAWGDLDAFGHVNNTVFFKRFEDARIAYFAAIGLDAHMRSTGVGPILARTDCVFRRPLGFPDTLRVGARVTRVDADRFTMQYRIVSEGQGATAGEGEGRIVMFDYGAERKAPLPESIRAAIEALESGTSGGPGQTQEPTTG